MNLSRVLKITLMSSLLYVAGATSVFAAEGSVVTAASAGWFALAAAFGIGIAAFGGALGQGRAISSALDGIARNPGATSKIQMPMLIGLAFIESLVIYVLIIAFALIGKL